MGTPQGFEYELLGDQIIIYHNGRRATMLRGPKARQFLEDVESGAEQELMARVTGNYKRGNERQARNHPRNCGG